MANIFEKIKKFLTRTFSVKESERTFNLNRRFTFRENALKNLLWYNGDADELQQFYSQAGNPNQAFWGSDTSKGQEIKRCHVGIPALIVDNLVNITANSMEGVLFENEKQKELWDEMNEDNVFQTKIADLTKTALIYGDGAVRYSFDLDKYAYPIMEVFPGDRVECIYQKGFLKEVHFFTPEEENGYDYTLEEIYGYGYIHYKLYDGDTEVPLDTIAATDGLEDVEFDKDVIMAVPFKFFDSTRYTGRGKSIYEGKIDAFDNIDECMSQWMDALRMARTQVYIPENLIPRNPQGGYLMTPNAFDHRYIAVGSNMGENAKNEITVKQPTLETNGYLQTYITALEQAIQGIVSPATLGIDVKKLDNAEAQREKEKVTLYTRSSILQPLAKITKKCVRTHFEIMKILYGIDYTDEEFNIDFGEYANPSFEAIVEVMSNPNTPMSIEAKVEELWGDSKTEEWKAEEVKRIKEERGFVELDEPALNAGLEDTL